MSWNPRPTHPSASQPGSSTTTRPPTSTWSNVSRPAAVTVFPDEYVTAPRSWTERAYHKLIYYNEVERGGHFAAEEQPQLFSEELRAAFRTPRKRLVKICTRLVR
jgi:pimeloyl-ACP methyl ester carboxylesterase